MCRPQILTTDQYTQVLLIKTKSQSETDAKEDWQELVQRGLSGKYNKDSTIQQFTDYYQAKWGAYNRYANDKVKQAANLKNIQTNMPTALKALNAARKYNNPINGDSQAKYSW